MLDPFQELKCPFLLSTWVEEPTSTAKIITFWPNLLSETEKIWFSIKSSSIADYLYLSISPFLDKVTAPDEQFTCVESSESELEPPSS